MNGENIVSDKGRGIVRELNVNNDCISFRTNLSSLIDGELSPEIAAAHEIHAASCPICESLLNQTVKLLKTAATLSQRPLPDGVAHRLRARLAEEGFNPPSNLEKVSHLPKRH